jgi:hypothetical protein
MEIKQLQERKKLEDRYRVPSVTDSPVKPMASPKVETKGRHHHHKKEEVLSEQQKEEKMFEIHNANGQFSCKCDVCVNHLNPQKRARKNPEMKVPLPPDTLKLVPKRVTKALRVMEIVKEYE